MYGQNDDGARFTQELGSTTQYQELCTLYIYFHKIRSQVNLAAERIEGDRLDRGFPDIPPTHQWRSGRPGSQRIHRAITSVYKEELLLGICFRDRLGNNCPLRKIVPPTVPLQDR